jgi:hypothetical protein
MKLMDDYNHHDWAKFMVTEASQKPKGPHFAAVLFETLEYTSPGYDEGDSDERNNFEHVVYFAFPDQETLTEWVLRASKDKKQFFCFEVKKLGTVNLKVTVDVGV